MRKQSEIRAELGRLRTLVEERVHGRGNAQYLLNDDARRLHMAAIILEWVEGQPVTSPATQMRRLALTRRREVRGASKAS